MPKSIMFETIALAMDAAEFNQFDVWTDEEHLALLRRYMSLLLRQERELDVTDFLPTMLSIAILLEDKYSESHVETRTMGIISTVIAIGAPRIVKDGIPAAWNERSRLPRPKEENR